MPRPRWRRWRGRSRSARRSGRCRRWRPGRRRGWRRGSRRSPSSGWSARWRASRGRRSWRGHRAPCPGGWWRLRATRSPSLWPRRSRVDGPGVALCLPAEPSEADVDLFLEAARAVLAAPSRFLLVQEGRSGAGFARTLHLELPAVATRVVELPLGDPRAAGWAAAEARAADRGWGEARWDVDGRRWAPVLRAVPPAPADAVDLPGLGPSDVLLVTGGGKGIAAECALALARASGARLALLGRSRPGERPRARRQPRAPGRRRPAAALLRCRRGRRRGRGRGRARRSRLSWGRSRRSSTAPAPTPRGSLGALDARGVPRYPGAQGARARATCSPRSTRRACACSSPSARSSPRPGCGARPTTRSPTSGWRGSSRRFAGRASGLPLPLPSSGRYGPASAWASGSARSKRSPAGASRRSRRTRASPRCSTSSPGRCRPPRSSSPAASASRRRVEVERPELPLLRFLERPRVHYPGIELVVDAELSADTDPYLDRPRLRRRGRCCRR